MFIISFHHLGDEQLLHPLAPRYCTHITQDTSIPLHPKTNSEAVYDEVHRGKSIALIKETKNELLTHLWHPAARLNHDNLRLYKLIYIERAWNILVIHPRP